VTDSIRPRAEVGNVGLLKPIRQRPALAIGVGLALVSLIVTLANAAGSYVGDNRFEQYWAPGGRLLRETALWDGGRGLGRVAEEFWPSTIPIALIRALGFSPALAERLWHASLLTLAGVGVLLVVRTFVPRVGALHAVAAFAYAFNPFSAVFLLPSVLFWNYAIAPFVVLALLRGVASPRSWRWPAVLALAVFSAGNADLPGTAYVLVLLVPTALYVVAVERSARWRDVGAFLVRAVFLTLLCAAAALTKASFGAASLEARLAATELPRRVNVTSSWSESWRGLGFWLSYFGDADDLGRLPGGRYYWETVPGVLITFVAPLCALVAVAWTRWRARWLFVALALTSLVLMVGSYPPDDLPPLGRGILSAFEDVAALASLRNTYKAGPGLAMATAVLLAVLTAAVAARARKRSPLWSRMPYVGAVVLIVAAAGPFVDGGLYPDRAQMDDLPGYWHEALEYVDGQPGDGRVLVLPGTTKTAYRWGWPGDDVFDAFLHRHPNVIANAFPLSEPLAASAIDALDDQVAAGTIAPGTIASVARRLGITQVIIRNDLDWDRSEVARPQDLDALRSDPTLVLSASFGEPGQNVVAADDDSVAARFEQTLPPVEVYDVTASTGPTLGRPALAPAVVAGDGSSMAQIGATGAVEDGRPIRFSGELEGQDLVDALGGGGPLVITDSNRRRVVRLRGAVPTRSETLGEDQELDQAPDDLWGRDGSQSVATFGDARQVSATASGTRLIGYQPWLRPANAFDDDFATMWLTGGLEDPVGNRIRVDFDRPLVVSHLDLAPFRPTDGGRAVESVRLRFSSGEPVDVTMRPSPDTDVTFPQRETDFLDVEITSVTREGEAAVGFREIDVPGVDLRERIRVPDDLFRRADEDDELAAALAEAPTTYLFERVIGRGEVAEEQALRRSFPMLQAGPAEVTGTLALHREVGDDRISAVLSAFDGEDVVSWGSSRFEGDLANRGEQATDGDPATSWGVRPEEGEVLTVTFPAQEVDEVRIRALGQDATALDSVVVTVGDRPQEVELEPADGCDSDDCDREARYALAEGEEVDRVEVRVGRTGPDTGRPVRIAEVEVEGPEGTVGGGARDGAACAGDLLSVDGTDVPVRLAADARDHLVDGRSVPFEACEPLELSPGDHELDSDGPLLDRLALAIDQEGVTPARGVEPTVDVVERTPDRLRLEVDAADPAWVGTGQSYDPSWTATADGVDLGPPVPIDGQSAWMVDPGVHDVELSFQPAGRYRLALAVTIFGVALCAGLALAPRRRARR
jgi:arabinofuranan 3-O-arabinosyltransferase